MQQTPSPRRPRIAVVGAFDRYNYGDVLFTAVTRAMVDDVAPGAEMRFYGLRAVDLTALGGVRTDPLRRLFHDPAHRPDAVILAGGDVLTVRWPAMVEHLVPHWAGRIVRGVLRRMGPRAANALCRRLMGVPSVTPWGVDPRDIDPDRPPLVFYNAVGAAGVGRYDAADQAWLRDALGRATWLSVRDARSRDALAAIGVTPPPEAIPDSAVIMDRLLSAEDRAACQTRLAQRGDIPADRPFICVQAGKGFVHKENGVERLAAALREVHARTGLDVVSFTIGRAVGHSDQFACAELQARLGAEPWFRVATEALTVDETMALIAASACYMGTSLHGYVTAFAHDVPRVGMHPGVVKLAAFSRDWDMEGMAAGLTFEQTPAAAAAALATDPAARAARREKTVGTYLDAARRGLAPLAGL